MFNRDSIELKELYRQCDSLDHQGKFTRRDLETFMQQMQVWPLYDSLTGLNVRNVRLHQSENRIMIHEDVMHVIWVFAQPRKKNANRCCNADKSI